MVYFQENYNFPTFSGGGVQLLIPMETYRTCEFSEGSGPPVPPLDQRMPKDS